MGLFDFITGSKSPAAGVTRQPPATLRAALLGLNRDSAPWQVRDGAPEGVDLVAEWKIVEARWVEIFAKASLTKVFKILMKLDEAKGEVRAVDQDWTVEWRAGVPTLALSAEAFRGQKVEMSFGTAIGFREDFSPGVIYEYRFATGEIKTPLQDAVLANGWRWQGVAFGKL
ncbi:MAG: hypothetical protein JNL14_02835 [Devosia sp.]|jgi:hypothetical protein|uniref:hypothetical protein n=1 Tax=Devosia sp. TaxID=1871048 RepID=UPI001A373C33|nr:hypothetical protein [Devosia sp.]MBL8596655.1 hypothetical protein [Devosia sp.]